MTICETPVLKTIARSDPRIRSDYLRTNSVRAIQRDYDNIVERIIGLSVDNQGGRHSSIRFPRTSFRTSFFSSSSTPHSSRHDGSHRTGTLAGSAEF